MELSDFQRRLLGFPQQAFGSVIADPNAPVEQQDMANARMDSIGQMGALLLAAGQRQSPQNRAAILARMAGVDSPDTLAMNAAQRRLYGLKMQQAQTEMQRQADLRQKMSDPAFLQGFNITPQMAEVMGPEGVADYIQKRASINPLDDQLKQAQIQHYLRPATANSSTPQMVDLPGGGKGWATPGSTEVVPISGAGKGSADEPKKNELESKVQQFAADAIAANKVLSDPEYQYALTSRMQQLGSYVPLPFMTATGNAASEDYRMGDQYAHSFVNSVLRPESGATYGPTEIAEKQSVYTPTPGDTPAIIADKNMRRRNAIVGLINQANPVDRPRLMKMLEEADQQLVGKYEKKPGNLPNGVRSIEEVR
jgi:hypothetical protein